VREKDTSLLYIELAYHRRITLLGTPTVFLNFFHFFLKHEKTLFSFPILGNLNIGQSH
jgi:hypothetical protein